MEDWTKTIGEKLGGMEMPLPDGDWSSLQREYTLKQRNRRRCKISILCGLASAAAMVILFFLLPGKHQASKLEWDCVVAQADPVVVLSLMDMKLDAINIKSRAVPKFVSVADVDTITADRSGGTVQETVPAVKSIDKEDAEPGDHKLYSDDLFELEDNYTPQRRLVSLGLEGSGGLMGLGQNALMEDTSNGMYDPFFNADLPIKNTENHLYPFTTGISARFYIQDRLSLNTGLNYTLYSSKYYTLSNDGSVTEKKQQVHYLGIPLTIDYSIVKRKYFTFYVGAGASVDKCIKAYKGDTTLKEDKFLFSFLGNLGLQYDITSYLGLYFEPDVMVRLNQGVIKTYRYENIAILSARAGLRFTF